MNWNFIHKQYILIKIFSTTDNPSIRKSTKCLHGKKEYWSAGISKNYSQKFELDEIKNVIEKIIYENQLMDNNYTKLEYAIAEFKTLKILKIYKDI